MFCREGMKEGREKNKRQISFHISLVGCEREMEKKMMGWEAKKKK